MLCPTLAGFSNIVPKKWFCLDVDINADTAVYQFRSMSSTCIVQCNNVVTTYIQSLEINVHK